MSAERGPWIDLHGHAGRCFLAGLPAGHPILASLGTASVPGAVRAAEAAGVTALTLATVSDFAVLRRDPVTGLRAHRDFRPGEAYADHRRQLEAIRRAVAAAGGEVATSAADVDRAARDGRTVVLLGCEGGDFLDGDLRRLEEARADGVTVLTLVHYRVNEIGDVQTEPPVHGGLSRLGHDVVAECNRLGVPRSFRTRWRTICGLPGGSAAVPTTAPSDRQEPASGGPTEVREGAGHRGVRPRTGAR